MDSPHKIAEELISLAEGYSKMSGQIIEVLQRKAVAWAEYRSFAETNKEADMKWEASEDGLTEMSLKLKMKASAQRQSALKNMLRVMENEARNNY